MKKIVIYAHDAGGSEILLELLKASLHDGEFMVCCLDDSPCYKLAKQKNLLEYVQTIEGDKLSVFQKLDAFYPDAVFYSTGWQNHIECHFLAYAKEHHLPSISFLDNWTNYRERFGYPDVNWRDNISSYIAAHDEASERLANSLGLPNVIGVKNYSLINQLKNFKKLDAKQEDILLFLSEPTAEVAKKSFGDENYWGFTQADIFKTILKYQDSFGCAKFVVRLHPSDTPDLYKNIYEDIEISNKTLEEDIASAKVIIGIDTVALYLGYLLGKKVLAYIPSHKREFCVPLPKENQIREFENINIDMLVQNKKEVKDYGMDLYTLLKTAGA